MAKSTHRRYAANSFCGTSALAFATNLRHHYLIAFHLYVLERQGASVPCIRTAENPKAERQLHPLTLNVLEQRKDNGGLGMAKAIVSYCTAVDAEWQKTSAIWTDNADTLAEFVRADGSVKFECSTATGRSGQGRARSGESIAAPSIRTDFARCSSARRSQCWPPCVPSASIRR